MLIKKDLIPSYLNKGDFHDLSISKIQLFFDKNEILFEFESWDEEKKDYVPFLIKLNNVTSFMLNNFKQNNFTVEELLSVKCKELNDGKFEAEFVFHRGHGIALWELGIIFSEIETISTSITI